MELTQLGLNGQVSTFACEGEITSQEILELDNPLLLILGKGCLDRTVLLDLQKARVIDTVGVHWLVTSHQRFEEAGGKLILHSVPRRIHDMLRFLQLDRVLHLTPNLTQALELARGLNHER